VRRLVFGIACVLAALVAAIPAAAGDGAIAISEAGRPVFPKRTFLLTLPELRLIGASDVRVAENGERVSKLSVKPAGGAAGSRLGFILVIDASESMAGAPIESAMAAARSFADQRKPNQQLAVTAFNADSQTLLSFTNDEEKITQALGATPEIAYFTRMYEALDEAIALTRSANLSTASIVLLSDGQELGSFSSPENAIAKARSNGIRIFTVGLRSRFYDAPTLKRLAAGTGGRYIEATNPEALTGIFSALGAQLANEYLLTYKSVVGPNEPVRVHVSVARTTWEGTQRYVTPALVFDPEPFERSLSFRVWTSPITMLFVALLCSMLIASAVIAVVRPRNKPLQRRMSEFVSVAPPARPAAVRTQPRVFANAGDSVRHSARWARFLEELEIAQIQISPVQIVIWTVLATLTAMWLAAALIGSPVFALVGLGVPFVVRGVIRTKLKRRRRLFEDQLPDNLQVLASAMRAGHSLIGALSVVVDDSPEPSRTEFQRVVADEQLGVPLEDALGTVVRRMDNRDLEQVAVVASLQRETGGNTAEVLDRVTETVRGRADIRRLVRTLTAQGRLARWVVSLLPVGLLLVISLINPEFIAPLFNEPLGRVMLAIAAIMVITGSLVIKKIVDIKV
jgi:tight adherence protein B